MELVNDEGGHGDMDQDLDRASVAEEESPEMDEDENYSENVILDNVSHLPPLEIKLQIHGLCKALNLTELPYDSTVKDLRTQIMESSKEIIKDEEQILEISLNDQVLLDESLLTNVLNESIQNEEEIQLIATVKEHSDKIKEDDEEEDSAKTNKLLLSLVNYRKQIKKLSERKGFFRNQPQSSRVITQSAISIVAERYTNDTLRDEHIELVNKIIVLVFINHISGQNGLDSSHFLRNSLREMILHMAFYRAHNLNGFQTRRLRDIMQNGQNAADLFDERDINERLERLNRTRSFLPRMIHSILGIRIVLFFLTLLVNSSLLRHPELIRHILYFIFQAFLFNILLLIFGVRIAFSFMITKLLYIVLIACQMRVKRQRIEDESRANQEAVQNINNEPFNMEMHFRPPNRYMVCFLKSIMKTSKIVAEFFTSFVPEPVNRENRP